MRLADGSTSVWEGSRLVGYAVVVRREAANPERRMRIELEVHPEYRDAEVGKQLIEWLARTGSALHAQTFPDARLELHARLYESQRLPPGWASVSAFGRVAVASEIGPLTAAAPGVGARLRPPPVQRSPAVPVISRRLGAAGFRGHGAWRREAKRPAPARPPGGGWCAVPASVWLRAGDGSRGVRSTARSMAPRRRWSA